MTCVDDRRAGHGSSLPPLGGGGGSRDPLHGRWQGTTVVAPVEPPDVVHVTMAISSDRAGPRSEATAAGTRRWHLCLRLGGTWKVEDLLGVVTCRGADRHQSSDVPARDPLERHLTRVDSELLSTDATTSPYPRRLDFPARAVVVTGLNLPGLDGAGVTTPNVIGHRVAADSPHGGHRCDIHVDLPQLAQSLRLALVRLRPVGNVESRLSRVVTAHVPLVERTMAVAS